MEHPFVIFTDFPWVWGPLYGFGLLVGLLFALAGSWSIASFFFAGVLGSFLMISFASVIFWLLVRW